MNHAQATDVYLQLGAVVFVLGLGARAVSRAGISPIPLYLLAGLVLGSLDVPALHGEFVQFAADLGVILLLFIIGLKYTAEDLTGHLRRFRGIAALDAALNFAPGFALGYAFLSDCEVGVLVAPTGIVEWMCLACFDGPSTLGPARPRRRRLPVLPRRHQRPGRPPLPARHDGGGDDLEHQHRLHRRLRRAGCANAIDHRGAFAQHYDTDSLDASCLLLPLVRFLPPDDDRVVATVNAIAEELTIDGFVPRYRTTETDDGLVGEEGAFTLCTFWLVSAEAEIGETARARARCEKALCHASPLYLYAEEIDPRSGGHWGNFRQAFSHLALINAVMHVIRADEALARREPLAATPVAAAVTKEAR